MVLFVAYLTLAGFLSMAVFQFVRQFRMRVACDERSRHLPFFLFVDSLMMFAEIMAGGDMRYRLPLDIFMAALPLLTLNSSVMTVEMSVRIAKIYLVLEISYIFYSLGCGTGMLTMFESRTYSRLIGVGTICLSAQYVIYFFIRIREIRAVMKSGNVWSCLLLAVEMVYLAFLFSYSSIIIMFSSRSPCLNLIVSLLYLFEIVALFVRLSNESVFVLWSEHERLIVESMRMSNIEVNVGLSKTDSVYKEIYERVVSLFEKDQLYLNSELTVNEIVKIVFTNRLYISKAINRFTGKNFCQFVNFYRVNHSVRVFRENPDLKVAELAGRSGFNSVASFSSAFKLYMGESPSDWCRKERSILLKRKK